MDIANPLSPGAATLYYDGRCPLCQKEMAKLEQYKSDQLQLADIHNLDDAVGLPDKDTLLRTLHLRLPDGQLLTGVDANVTAWGYTDRGKWLHWLRWPLVRPLADLCYGYWAAWRYRRLYSRACAVEEATRCD